MKCKHLDPAGISKVASPRQLARLFLVVLCLAAYGCGGSVSEAENQALDSDQPGSVETPDDSVLTPPTGPSVSGDELDLLPTVTVGARQFADPNVMVTLNGSVEAAQGAQIARTLWVQTGGTTVRIADPTSPRTAIVIPDVVESSQLEFRLIAEDSEGRVNSAVTSVVVVPQPLFARVIGTVVNESDVAAVFTVRLSAPATEQVVLLYRTVEGTALVESDFLPVEGVLTFEVGEQEKQVAVTLVDDNVPEDFKSFSLQVVRTGAGTSFSNVGVAVINNGVEPPLDQVIGFVNPGPVDIIEGQTYTNALDTSLTPQGQGQVVYTSYNPTVASVAANGLVVGLSPGVATIEVTRKADDTYREASAFFDVNVSASDLTTQVIQFQNAGPVDLLINAVTSNPIVDDPQLAPGSGAITYSSSAVAIAIVDTSGNVVPVSPGTATITATKAADLQYASATASYDLTVSLLSQNIAFTVSSLTINAGQVGRNVLDTSVVAPGTGAITYTSSDTAVATVDASGFVTGVGAGTATITATKAADSLYGEATASYDVTVVGLLPQTVFFVQPDMTVGLGGVASNPLASSSVLGTGAITYQSSDTQIATVDASGIVTAGTLMGPVTITATVDPDAVYQGSSASYVLTVVESNTPISEAYIKASNAEANDQFGGSFGNRGVDMNGDTLIVGAIAEDSFSQAGSLDELDNTLTDTGAAYIFRRDSSGLWQQEAFLKSLNTDFGDAFGHDVAIANGVAAVGAPFSSGQGAVFVFRFDANLNSWGLPEQINPPTLGVLGFGSSVVINDTGDVIAVSAPSIDQSPLPSVYVYRYNGASWDFEIALTSSNEEADDGFGEALAMEGDTIVVGAPFEDSALSGINAGDGSDNSAVDSGATYIFERVNGTWNQTYFIKHQSNTGGIQMGSDVSIDGDHLAIADSSDINSNGVGYRIYERQNGVWTQGTQVIYGDSIAMENKRLIIARLNSEVFINRLNQENLYTPINSIPAQSANFAQTLAISGDIVVVGAPLDASGSTGIGGDPLDTSAPQSGAVHAFCFDLINACTPQP